MRHIRQCRECGERFESAHYQTRFCCQAHRIRFNNRRASRGAALYDLFMTTRFERAKATELQVWSVMCTLASQWRDDDRAELAGRKSWQDARTAIAETVFGPRGPKPLVDAMAQPDSGCEA